MKNFLRKPITAGGYLKYCGVVLAIYAIGFAIYCISLRRKNKKKEEVEELRKSMEDI